MPEPGAIYVMDRGYIDFERLGRFHEAGSFFVIRAKKNLNAERRYSRNVDRSTGPICDVKLIQHCAIVRSPLSARQIESACKSAAIFMVAKLEKVSEIAYGRTIRSPWRIAPQV